MSDTVNRPPEMGPSVAWMYDYWASSRQDARLPTKQAIDAYNIGRRNPAILRHLCLYNVERDPYRFQYRLVGGAIPDAGGLAKPGQYIDELEPTGQVDAKLIQVCETEQPWYKIGPAMIAHLTNIVDVEVITLPLLGEGARIEFLLSCTVYHWEIGYTPNKFLDFSRNA
jgi:hypothetical protein